MENTHQGSVSQWIVSLKQGDRVAAQNLWERYFERLVRLSRARLGEVPMVARDEEDIALSVFDSFCRAVEAGRFPDLEDRDDLWKLLVVITVRKSVSALRHELAVKRAQFAPMRELDLDNYSILDLGRDLEEHVGQEPTPEQAALLADESRYLLLVLDQHDPELTLRAVALKKLEGFTNREIGNHLNCSERTVRNRLRWIRGIWSGVLS